MVLIGKGVVLFCSQQFLQNVFIFHVSLVTEVAVTVRFIKHEFKESFSLEVTLIWPSLMFPVITFLKLWQIKKNKNPTDVFELPSLVIAMLFFLFFSLRKTNKYCFTFSIRAVILCTKGNTCILKSSAGSCLWHESLFDKVTA